MNGGLIIAIVTTTNNFLSFGKYTEPDRDFIDYLKEKYKEIDPKNIREIVKTEFSFDINISQEDKIYTAKELMRIKKHGGCNSLSVLASSILKSFNYPTAIIICLKLDSIFYNEEFVEKAIKKFGKDKEEKIRKGCYCGHTCNLVYFKNKWYLLDLAVKENWLTEKIAETLFDRKLLPVFVINDFEELNVKTRSEIYIKAFKKAKEFLLIDFQKERLFPVWKELLENESKS